MLTITIWEFPLNYWTCFQNFFQTGSDFCQDLITLISCSALHTCSCDVLMLDLKTIFKKILKLASYFLFKLAPTHQDIVLLLYKLISFAHRFIPLLKLKPLKFQLFDQILYILTCSMQYNPLVNHAMFLLMWTDQKTYHNLRML